MIDRYIAPITPSHGASGHPRVFIAMLGFGLPSRAPTLQSLPIVEEDLPLFSAATPSVLKAPQSPRNRRTCLTKLVSEGVKRGSASKVTTKPVQ